MTTNQYHEVVQRQMAPFRSAMGSYMSDCRQLGRLDAKQAGVRELTRLYREKAGASLTTSFLLTYVEGLMKMWREGTLMADHGVTTERLKQFNLHQRKVERMYEQAFWGELPVPTESAK